MWPLWLLFSLPSAPVSQAPIWSLGSVSKLSPSVDALPVWDPPSAGLCLAPPCHTELSFQVPLPQRHLRWPANLRSPSYSLSHHSKLSTPHLSPSDTLLLLREWMVYHPAHPNRAGRLFVLFTTIFQCLEESLAYGRHFVKCLWTGNINFYSSARWELLSPFSTRGNWGPESLNPMSLALTLQTSSFYSVTFFASFEGILITWGLWSNTGRESCFAFRNFSSSSLCP